MILVHHRQALWLYVLIACSALTKAATLKAIFQQPEAVPAEDEVEVSRVARDSKYFLARYANADAEAAASSTALKPEESPEARQAGERGAAGVEKRCTRCYSDYDRYDGRSRYNSDYSSRSRYPDYDYDRAYDRSYDRYDRYDKDRGYYDRYYDRYDRYDRDRGDPRDRYDRYDRYQDRGIGYDNRGYDYRGGSSRPYDDLSRGYDRGYDRYASNYYYGSGRGGGDDYYYRDRGWSDRGNQKPSDKPTDRYYGGSSGGGGGGYGGIGGGYGGGGGGGGYRGRDPYYPYYDNGYRGTSYLYGRPSSSTTTLRPSSQDDNSVTDAPQQTNSPSG